jgi:hypothetical protein
MHAPARRLFALTLLALGSVSGVALTASPAWACDEPSRPFGVQMRAAEFVFTGTVTQVVDSGDRNVFVVDVNDVYKGRVTAEATVTSPATRADCGLRGIERGERYVFLAGSASSGVIEATSDEGTRPQRPAVVKAVTRVLGEGQDPTAPTREDAVRDDPAELTRLDDSGLPSIAVATLPGVALALLGLLVLGVTRALGRSRS